jgi:hypothetical protein
MYICTSTYTYIRIWQVFFLTLARGQRRLEEFPSLHKELKQEETAGLALFLNHNYERPIRNQVLSLSEQQHNRFNCSQHMVGRVIVSGSSFLILGMM